MVFSKECSNLKACRTHLGTSLVTVSVNGVREKTKVLLALQQNMLDCIAVSPDSKLADEAM